MNTPERSKKIRREDKIHAGKWATCQSCNPQGAARAQRLEQKFEQAKAQGAGK